MRIAIFHNLLSGGAKRALREATVRLAARHHVEAFALSCSDHEFADIRPLVARHCVVPFEPLRLLNSPFGRINQALRCADLRRLDRVARDLAGQIDQQGYDVAFVHPCQFEQGPSVLKYLKRTPTLYYCQEPRRSLYETMPARPYDDEAFGRRRVLNRLDPLPWVYQRMLRHVDRANTQSASAVLVNSRFMAEALVRIYGVDARVSYLGVDAERFAPLPVGKERLVLSVGSLTPLKGFDFLIRAMAQYPRGNRPTLVIASNFQNPPERDYLEGLARDLTVELALKNNVRDDELVQLYNRASVVAYAAVREPFGLVPLEAMSCGTPVVAVAEGGVTESVIHEQTGVLVARDPKLFADAVRHVVENPSLARRLGKNGRRHVVSQWSWDRAVASLEAHLKSATELHSRVPTRIPVMAQ